jgi:RHS repeat-associated protein
MRTDTPTTASYKFTGKERDDFGNGTNLDKLGARYNSSSTGRFMTPDWSDDPDAIPYSDSTDPESLNRYSTSPIAP